MINEDLLLKNLQNGIAPDMKLKLLHEYKNYWHSDGFEKGFQDCQKTIKKSTMKIYKTIEEKKNKLLDDIRDEIWKKNLINHE
jgi:hypothetical protein